MVRKIYLLCYELFSEGLMTEVNEAKKMVLSHAKTMGETTISLIDALGKTLAKEVIAPIDHPIFNQSAVDGYALQFNDRNAVLQVVGEVQAGDDGNVPMRPGESIRIFTGAPVPAAADTVVMQEYVEVTEAGIVIKDEGLKEGGNVRKQGEQIRKGQQALAEGTRLNAASIGFLASLGIKEVTVNNAPTVGMLITGNEFADDVTEATAGKIFESNGAMLQAALQQYGIKGHYRTCEDNPDELLQTLRELAAAHEVLFITGGVSVGAYDFTRSTLEAAGFEVVFHKVNQKPGKPLLFATNGSKIAFGLPGNPRAVMICFYQYILPFLGTMMGQQSPGLPTTTLPLHQDFTKRDNKTHFAAGRMVAGKVEVLRGQNSHMLQSLAAADVLIEFPPHERSFTTGTLMKTYLLP